MPFDMHEGYANLVEAVFEKSDMVLRRYLRNGSTAPLVRPPSKRCDHWRINFAVTTWAWRTGRGEQARLEAGWFYQWAGVKQQDVVLTLWDRFCAINRERMHALEDTLREGLPYDLPGYDASWRLSLTDGNQPQSTGDVLTEPTALRADLRDADHPSITPTATSVLAGRDEHPHGSSATALV